MGMMEKLKLDGILPRRSPLEKPSAETWKALLRRLQAYSGVQRREKSITALSRTPDGIEWTHCRIRGDETEQMQQGSAELEFPDDSAAVLPAVLDLPEDLAERIDGDVTVALRTSELLLRVMEVPTVEKNEIADMAVFQIDKISPFPQDQLAISHEVLQQTEERSLVLMAASRRKCIDAIGDSFQAAGIRVHSIDARVLGWLRLMRDAGHLDGDRCEIIILCDGIDRTLVVTCSGLPMIFRPLDRAEAGEDAVQELTREIGYTLTLLETEHALPAPSGIRFWSADGESTEPYAGLAEVCGIPVEEHRLAELPPLSEGLIRRARAGGSRIELVPREWIEHAERRRLQRKYTLVAAAIAAVWLVVLLGFFITYKVRDVALKRAEAHVAAIEPEARQALENRRKLTALKVYTDRSDSALECLREVTALLPAEGIEFSAYSYTKGKGVTLRGTAEQDNTAYDFFEALTGSGLFTGLKDQNVNTKVDKGVRSAVFAVTLNLPEEEVE